MSSNNLIQFPNESSNNINKSTTTDANRSRGQNSSSNLMSRSSSSSPKDSFSSQVSSSTIKSKAIKYVYDLPYNVRKCLCDLLDADGSWRQLGGEYFGLDEIRLTLVSHAFLRGGSPTNDLLIKWEQTNPKIWTLFQYFSNMKHLRAMNILKPFIDPVQFEAVFAECSLNSRPLFVDLDRSKDNYDDKKNVDKKCFDLENNVQGAVGGHGHDQKLLPPYNSEYYHHDYVNLNNDNEFKVSNNDLGKVRVSKTWNNFEEEDASNSKCSNHDPSSPGQASPPQSSPPQQQQQLSTPNNGLNSPSFMSSTRTSMLSQVEEDLEIMYKELMIATDDFADYNIIGSGGFGVVYKGEWKGTQVAIKRMKNPKSSSDAGSRRDPNNGTNNNQVTQAITELRILNRYRIDNILPLYGISLDGPEPCIVYQFMSNGSLEDRLLCKNISSAGAIVRRSPLFGANNNNSIPSSAAGSKPNANLDTNGQPFQVLTWTQRAIIGEGIARALNYLHTLKGKPLVHGDVKSANVLLDAQFEPKLGDFGLSRQVTGDSGSIKGMYTHVTVTSVHGTSVYLPPEYLRQKILSPAVDTYSYGIVMLEMATGKRAFDGRRLLIDLIEDEIKAGESDNHREGAIKLRDAKLSEGSEGQSWFHSLIKLGIDCAHKSKRKRPDMSQVLDFYATCKTRDRIRRLSLESIKNGNVSKDGQSPEAEGIEKGKELFRQRSGSGTGSRTGSVDCGPSLPLPPDNADIRTPLELQLWYDMVRKETRNVDGGSTICPTIGSSTESRNDNNSQQFSDSSIYSNVSNVSKDFVDVLSIPVPLKRQSEDNQGHEDANLGDNQDDGDDDNDSGNIIPLITELGINK